MTKLNLIPKHWLNVQCSKCRHDKNVPVQQFIDRGINDIEQIKSVSRCSRCGYRGEAEMQRLTARGEKALASKFTDKQRAEICQRRANGETYSSIGKTYGKGVSTIKYICQVWGPDNGYPFQKINGERNQAFTKEQKAEMCKRRADGETFDAIAKDYGATFQNVHGICSVWGPKNGYPFDKTR